MLQNALIDLIASKNSKLIFQDQIISSQQLVLRIKNIILMLDEMNLDSQQFIAFCMPNSPELFCWHLACFYKGIPIVPVIYEHDAAFIQQVIELTKPTYLMTTTEKQKTLLPTQLCQIKVNDETHQIIIANKSPINNLSIAASRVDDNALAMVIFSSGTSGVLKGIKHSYQSTYGFMQTLIEILSIENGLTYLVAQPMGHIGGITTTLLTLLHNGAAILLQNFEINLYMKTMQRYQPTHINLHTPLFYEIINYSKINKEAFSKVKICFAGGDTIPTDLPEKFTAATGAPMQTGYGMTEIGIVIYNNNPYGKFAGASGTQINIAKVDLRNPRGQSVPVNEVGEIWIKSPGCCLGYWSLPELDEKIFAQGWFRTFDLAYLDEDGYYWYKGRDSQIIHRGTHLIYPEKIEKVLFEFSDVNAAAVIAKKDSQEGEVPIAFVELKTFSDQPSAKEKILKFISTQLQTYEIPQQIIILTKLPLNLTGKIDRKKLAAML